MHVFPGMNYFNGIENMWQSNYTDLFLSIIERHQSSILLGSAAHSHRAELRDSIFSENKNLSIPFLITPSITPDCLNNPSYTTLEIH